MNALTDLWQADRDHYDRDGYILLKKFLSEPISSIVRDQVAAAYDWSVDDSVPLDRPIIVLWRHESQGSRSIVALDRFPELFNFIKSDAVLSRARYLTDGDQLQLFETSVFSKPPSKGEQFAWHNDASYYPFAPKKILSFWVALDYCNHENGSMEIAVGSHKFGDVEPVDLKTGKSLVSLSDDVLLDPFREKYVVSQPVLDVGDAIAFDGYTWHGSSPNRSSRIRRGLCFRFLTEQATYEPFVGMGGTFIRQMNFSQGDKIFSPSYPVLWSAG